MSGHVFALEVSILHLSAILIFIEANRSQDDSAKDDELMSTRSRSAEHHLNQ
jgi:hypothetical protein